MRFIPFFTLVVFSFYQTATAQMQMFERLNPPVVVNGQQLDFPFVGGLNNPQFSEADLNRDGIQDLVLFDRVGDIVLTFLNLGTPNQVSYIYAPEYACNFPKLLDYVLLRDFNKDGAADIFCAATLPGDQEMQVFRGYYDNNVLKFTQFKFHYPNCSICGDRYIWFPDNDQPGFWNNLPISKTDYPVVDDIDGDGDLDILTFPAGVGGHVWYLRNQSVEKGFGTDSLQFRLADDCWGRHYENGMEGCKSQLSANGTTCVNGLLGNTVEARNPHAGSTMMSFDQNGDGDKEVVQGNIGLNCLNMLTNGGTPTQAWMVAQDTAFPSYNEPIDLYVFPAAYNLDLNNDGRKDLVVAPNNKPIGEDRKCVWFYENTSPTGNNFELAGKNTLVRDMVDLGTVAHPTFADVNGDDLLDLVVGNYGYFTLNNGSTNASLYLFINTGTFTEPRFTLTDSDWLGMSQFTPNDYDFAPTFGDIDDDGDLDLLVGNNTGSLYCYRNTAGPNNPMNLQLDNDVMWISMDVIGVASTPAIYDLDGDGLVDVVMGERLGYLSFFKNIGTGSNPQFNSIPTLQTLGAVDTKLPFEAVGFSAPAFIRTETGPLLICGAQSGRLSAFTNLSATNSAFQLVTDMWGGTDDGNRSSPAFADINNDGILEMMTGNQRGGLTLYRTQLKDCSVTTKTTNPAQMLPISITPNPAATWVRVDVQTLTDVQWRASNTLGQTVASGKSTGTFTLDVQTWQAGIYYLEVTSGTQRGTAKLLVHRF